MKCLRDHTDEKAYIALGRNRISGGRLLDSYRASVVDSTVFEWSNGLNSDRGKIAHNLLKRFSLIFEASDALELYSFGQVASRKDLELSSYV